MEMGLETVTMQRSDRSVRENCRNG